MTSGTGTNTNSASFLDGLRKNGTKSSSGNERIHMLCVNVNILCVFSEKSDVSILRCDDYVKVILVRDLVNSLSKLKHSLTPHKALGANLKIRGSDFVILVHLKLPLQLLFNVGSVKN